MSNSSLSTVVSDLVRASVGTSIPNSVTDEDLDKAVAELILKEAKQKAERYLKYGVQAYLPDPEPDESLPRTNKRFLSAIIRSTDDHNKAILRAQAEAAQEAQEERIEQERSNRRARASQSDVDRVRRLMGGASHRREDSTRESSRRRHGRSRSRSREKLHDRDRREGSRQISKHKHRSRSRSPRRPNDREDNYSKRSRVAEDDDKKRKRKYRKHTKSSSPSARHSFSRSPSQHSKRTRHDDEEEDPIRTVHSEERSRPSPSSQSTKPSTPAAQATPGSSRAQPPRRPEPASPTLSEEEDIERMRPRRRRPKVERNLPDPERSSPGAVASKMDKYFESSYDPRLDIEPMTLPTVPSTGLIDGTEFERWEAMLDVIRQRREDKLERKRLERQGLLPDKSSSTSKVSIKGEMASSSAWKGEGASMMDVKYSKRGSVREWDMGKEGF